MRIEKVINEKIDLLPESSVKEAMRYALLAGGKRIRPNLLYETVKAYGLDECIADEFACALEMIHTYSLIHDDLPAMDDDELRRGRPTCHIQYGEACAILAGDGLLTYAFEVAASSKSPSERVIKAVSVLAQMAGARGMVLGQDLDMKEESGKSSWEDIKKVHRYKTGCLLSAPFMIGALLAGKDSDVEKMHHIGETLGLAFQIQDDILDTELTPEEFGKSVSDEKNEKVTSVDLLGKEQAEKLMLNLYVESERELKEINDFKSDALVALIEKIKTRRK